MSLDFASNYGPETGANLHKISWRHSESISLGCLLRFWWNGQEVLAHAGETVAAALLAAGQRTLRLTTRRGEPRGVFCGMGICFDCLVRVDGRPNVRACQTPVADGMRVETQQGSGSWERPA
jgi:aerobic-type carbon monoxide dehydrogenase small subunit (CoxS/CutS family)